MILLTVTNDNGDRRELAFSSVDTTDQLQEFLLMSAHLIGFDYISDIEMFSRPDLEDDDEEEEHCCCGSCCSDDDKEEDNDLVDA